MRQGQTYSGLNGPDGVEANGVITWSTDAAKQERGWHVCAVAPTPAPTVAPTPSPTSAISVVGPCDVFGDCVQSPNYPSNYGSSQSCTIGFRSDGTIYVDEFVTEYHFDKLILDGTTYSGATSPDGVSVTSGSIMLWTTDYGTTHKRMENVHWTHPRSYW